MAEWLFGIEQEIPLLRDGGTAFVDFGNTKDTELQGFVDALPVYEGDYPDLRIGDLGIKHKRWYVEGYERFAEDGSFLETVPKSFEIRTTPHDTMDGALDELRESYGMLRDRIVRNGFIPVRISFNPFAKEFVPDPPINDYERKMRGHSPEAQTATIATLTFGPDLSLSCSDFGDTELIDIAKKLTFYSPFIIPFSFSSPFFGGKLWEGLSVRNFLRTGARPAALVFLHDNANLLATKPTLTEAARVPREAGRIEFKAFDTCSDPKLYRALFVLLKGMILDHTLDGRAEVPDAAMHKASALKGFGNEAITAGTRQVLAAARAALADDPDLRDLDILEAMLAARRSPAHDTIETYEKNGSILETLKTYENLIV